MLMVALPLRARQVASEFFAVGIAVIDARVLARTLVKREKEPIIPAHVHGMDLLLVALVFVVTQPWQAKIFGVRRPPHDGKNFLDLVDMIRVDLRMIAFGKRLELAVFVAGKIVEHRGKTSLFS
jgi:hypothetical protein